MPILEESRQAPATTSSNTSLLSTCAGSFEAILIRAVEGDAARFDHLRFLLLGTALLETQQEHVETTTVESKATGKL